MFLRKSIPALYAGLGIFLPLITTNCAVMGVCLINIKEEYTFMQALVSSFAYAVGFGLALILFAAVRERVLLADLLRESETGLLKVLRYEITPLLDRPRDPVISRPDADDTVVLLANLLLLLPTHVVSASRQTPQS